MFDIGADLATPEGAKNESKIQRIGQEHVEEVENLIDEIDGNNTPLTAFVMPGGTELASRLHLARTICRRHPYRRHPQVDRLELAQVPIEQFQWLLILRYTAWSNQFGRFGKNRSGL